MTTKTAAAQNAEQLAAALTEYWSPQVIGQINDQYVKVARVKGDLAWHKHDHEDEMFFILSGRLTIEYEDKQVHLEAGDFHIVPRNTMHNPVCEEECLIMLVEPVDTAHTGTKQTEKTKAVADQLAQFDGNAQV